MAEGELDLYVDAPTLKKGLEGIVEEDSRQAITSSNYPWRVVGNSGTVYEISRTGIVTIISGVALNTNKVNFKVTGGETQATLTATLSSDLIGKTVEWSIPANNGVASISATQGESITVTKTGTAVGQTTITAHVDGITPDQTCTVKILEVVDHVSLTPNPLNIQEGKTGTLTLTAYGASNSLTEADSVSYSSSNTSIATVDNNGVVTGVAEGTTTITVTADGKEATATVNVEESVDPPTLVSEDDNLIVVNVTSFAALKGYNKLPSTKNLKAIKNSGQTNEQQMIVPAGFTVVEGKKLEDGMVIQDATYTDTIGSEFVWVPVGQTLTFAGTQGTGSITLSRYSFNTSNGTPTAQPNEDNPTGGIALDSNSSYNATETASNTVARKTNNNTEIEFVKQANENKGYYIGRYEAGLSETTDNNSLSTKTAVDGSVKPVTIAGRGVWNTITRNNAKTVSQSMYSNNTKFKSELLTSYAWDTAVVFIEKCGTNSNYANRNRFQSSLKTTGNAKSGTTYDVQCNIYDMAGNVYEWTTEYSSVSGSPCVNRGGFYDNSNYCVRYRNNNSTTYSNGSLGFRPLLYIM